MVLTALLLWVSVITVTSRGDQVMRVGVLAAVCGSLPWAGCSAIAACFHDPSTALRLLRLGNGPVSLIGPALLLLLLGASGQLERQRWVARSAAVLGIVSMVVTWTTDLMIRDVRLLPSGIYYSASGPLLGPHVGLIAVWAGIGAFIIRRAVPGDERNRAMRSLIAMLVLGTFGLADTMLAYGIAGWVPMAWLPAIACTVIALHLVRRKDLLRSQGFDLATTIEVASCIAIGTVLSLFSVFTFLGDVPAFGKSLMGASVLVVISATTRRWIPRRQKQPQSELVAAGIQWAYDLPVHHELAMIENELSSFWQTTLSGVQAVRVYRHAAEQLLHQTSKDSRAISPSLVTWFLQYRRPLLVADLATMLVGERRNELEQFVAVENWQLWVPIVSREKLWGFIVARFDSDRALSDIEREFAAVNADTVGRAGTRAELLATSLASAAVAREVELGRALRNHAAWATDNALHLGWEVVGHRGHDAHHTYVEYSWHVSPPNVVNPTLTVLAVEVLSSPSVGDAGLVDGTTTASALIGTLVLGAFVTLESNADEQSRQLRGVDSAAAFATALRTQLATSVDQSRVRLSVIRIAEGNLDVDIDNHHELIRSQSSKAFALTIGRSKNIAHEKQVTDAVEQVRATITHGRLAIVAVPVSQVLS
jgi:hypothetical protein